MAVTERAPAHPQAGPAAQDRVPHAGAAGSHSNQDLARGHAGGWTEGTTLGERWR